MSNSTPTDSSQTFELERRDWIAGLEKGLAVIEAFDAEHPRLTAARPASAAA